MNVRTLAILAGVLSLGEIGSAVVIWKENYPDAQPLFAVVFAALFLAAAFLVRRGWVGGAILVGVLCVFELISFPSWTRHSAFDWASQSVYAAVVLAGLLTAIAVLVRRQRSLVTTSTTTS
jgi:hypothetical protein